MNAPLNSRSLTSPETPELQRGNPGYAPSAVPMVVHRQVISELEGAKHHIQVLTQDNQRLQQQNQDLLVEIERVVKAVRRLQGLAEHLPSMPSASPRPHTSGLPVEYSDRLPPEPQRQPIYSEISEPAPYPEEQSTRLQREGGGLWLVLTVLLIVVTAFGTGFLIVRPFLSNSNSNSN
ncbi:MAG: hypothetical protein ACO3EZ_05025 [Prochlorotrichaceae cyanobacterium]